VLLSHPFGGVPSPTTAQGSSSTQLCIMAEMDTRPPQTNNRRGMDGSSKVEGFKNGIETRIDNEFD
jgi:hypothetical protein